MKSFDYFSFANSVSFQLLVASQRRKGRRKMSENYSHQTMAFMLLRLAGWNQFKMDMHDLVDVEPFFSIDLYVNLDTKLMICLIIK